MRIVIEEPCEHDFIGKQHASWATNHHGKYLEGGNYPKGYREDSEGRVHDYGDCPGTQRRILHAPTEHAILAWIEEPYEAVDGTIMPLSILTTVSR